MNIPVQNGVVEINVKTKDMSNCKSGLVLGTETINIGDRKAIKDFLKNFLSVDGDISDVDAAAIVDRCMVNVKILNIESFEVLFDSVFVVISHQDYYGSCDFELIDLKDGRIVVVWAVGGNNSE